MKRLIILLFVLFYDAVHAQTINIDWLVDNSVYNQSTCEYGGDLIVPTAPIKYGYTFNGWESFTPIEYLESTGTQYIDPDITLNIFLKFEFESALSSIDKVQIFGVGGGSMDGASIRANGAGQYFAIYQAYNHYFPCNIPIDTKRHKFILDIYNFEAYIDDCYLVMPGTYPVNETNKKIYIGAYSQEGRVNLGLGWIGKYYNVKFYSKNVLVRDFIPVLDGDGVPCMYDKVEGKFYYNQGTGQFIAGPVIGGN